MKTILLFWISFIFSTLLAKDYGDIPWDWREIKPSYDLKVSAFGNEFGKVQMFDSALYFPGNLYYQISVEKNESQILKLSLETGEKKVFPFFEGKIIGWTTYNDELVILVKKKILFLDPMSLQKKRELPSSIQSDNFRDVLVIDKILHSFQKNKVFTYDISTGVKLEEKDFPFDSVQRILPYENDSLLLFSSFWGNRLKVINKKSFQLQKEISLPTNHRALFKLSYTENNRYLVADPLTSQFSEWIELEGNFFETSTGLEVSKRPVAIRHTKIQNTIEYKLKITAKEDVPETMINFVLPKQNTYSQETEDERFSKSSEVDLDTFGNRILILRIPSLKKMEVFEHTPYTANLNRYKIFIPLKSLKLELGDLKVPQDLLPYTTNHKLLKMDDPVVIEKRKEITGESTSIAEILSRTLVYVASIPYKSGSFSSAPLVIEKNNGGCTEHSYVTMAILRGYGIPSRMVWNYLPTESANIIFFNHKYVEVWLPGFGWIPMEPLASPHKIAGSTNARHVIFAGLEKTSLDMISGGDRLFSLSKSDLQHAKKMNIQFEIQKSGANETLEPTEIKLKSTPVWTGDEMGIP